MDLYMEYVLFSIKKKFILMINNVEILLKVNLKKKIFFFEFVRMEFKCIFKEILFGVNLLYLLKLNCVLIL